MIFIKKLTKSDLTIIKRFSNVKLKQEAIVISRGFIETLGERYYDMERGLDMAMPMRMSFFGPNGKGEIVKSGASIGRHSHDWRIQGCTLDDPVSDPDRFKDLSPGDYFLFTIDLSFEPAVASGIFVERLSEADNHLHRILSNYAGKVGCERLIRQSINTGFFSGGHPIFTVLSKVKKDVVCWSGSEIKSRGEELDLLQAGSAGVSGFFTEMTKGQLRTSLEESDRIGYKGEFIFNDWLNNKPVIFGKKLFSHQWISNKYATAPYDFELDFDDGEQVFLELKTTAGPFENKLFMSMGELSFMASSIHNVVIARLSNVDEEPALRFSENVRVKAEEILKHSSFPRAEIGIVTMWIKPDYFNFNKEIIKI